MKKAIFFVVPLAFMAFAFVLVSPVNVRAQTTESCPSITINNVSYSLNPCSINIVMVDGRGNKDFSTSVIGKGSYGIVRYGYGEGFPTYSILGMSSSGAFDNTTFGLYFNDEVLNADGNLPHVYEGTLPFGIFQGSARGDDNNFLRLKIKLTVIPDMPNITVLSPDGGEELYADTTTLITWDSYKSADNVDITLLNDNGVKNSIIASNVSNSGQYYWKIPSNISTGKYQILVGNLTTKDKSNQSFMIHGSAPTGTLSVTPIGENILSGGTTTLIFTTHSNATSTLLNLVCPVGVSAKWINGGSSVEMCNVKKTFGRSAPSVFLQINNTTPVVQTIVPNFYEFLSDNPTYAVGVSSKITVQPEKTNLTIPCYQFNTNLNIGSTGPDVVALQTVLIAMGYKIPDISSGVAKKGYYGQSTADAVKAYQTAIGIVATGFFGPLTRTSLNSTLCKNDSSVANIIVRVNPQTPPSRIQTTSTGGTTNGVVLGMFDFKSENKSSTINQLNFVLKDDGKNKLLQLVFNKIYLVVDGISYYPDKIASNLVFSNLKIALPQNIWKTVVLKADVADQDDFINGTTASTSIIASAYNIVGIDNDSKNTTSNGGNSATSNDITFLSSGASISNQTATIVGNDNGSQVPTSATVTFGFTFNNRNTEDLYISANPNLALKTSSTISTAVSTTLLARYVTVVPSTVAGDSAPNTDSGYYIIPGNTSRHFTFTGTLDNKNGISGLQSVKISAVYFTDLTYISTPRTYSINFRLEGLQTPTIYLAGNSSVSVPVVSNTSATVVANNNGTSAPTSATATFKFTLTANDKDIYLSKKSALSLTTQAGATASANYSSAVPATVAGDTSDVYVIPANVSRTFTYTGTLDNSKGNTGLVSAKVSFINYGFSYSNANSLKITSGLEKLQTSPINLKGNSTTNPQSTITISSPQSGQSLITGNNYEIRLSSPVNDFVYYQIALKNKYSGTIGTMIANNVNKSTTSYSFKITDDMVKNVVANSGGNTADQIKNYYYVEALAMKPVYLKSNGAFAGYSYDVSGKSDYFTINAPTYTPTPTINYSPSPIPTYSTVPTYSPTPAYTPTSTYSPTPTVTNNPTPTPTTYYSTPTVTSTPSPSVTPTSTPTPTYAPNPSSSPVSQSVTPTQTASVWDMIKKMFGF